MTNNATIWLIDDDDSIRWVLDRALSKAGYHTEIFSTADDALHHLQSSLPEVIVTDIRMPGIDGNGVVEHIRKSKKQAIPVIAISGTPWLMEADDFDMVLSKPFPVRQLIESIRSLLPLPPRAAVGA